MKGWPATSARTSRSWLTWSTCLSLMTTRAISTTPPRTIWRRANALSALRRTFRAKTLSRSSSDGLASLTSHTRANVPTHVRLSSANGGAIGIAEPVGRKGRKQICETHLCPACGRARSPARSRPWSCRPAPCSGDAAGSRRAAARGARSTARRTASPAARGRAWRRARWTGAMSAASGCAGEGARALPPSS